MINMVNNILVGENCPINFHSLSNEDKKTICNLLCQEVKNRLDNLPAKFFLSSKGNDVNSHSKLEPSGFTSKEDVHLNTYYFTTPYLSFLKFAGQFLQSVPVDIVSNALKFNIGINNVLKYVLDEQEDWNKLMEMLAT